MTPRLLPPLFAALFAVAHTQSPLYYSNQNQYFLHGAAHAEVGHLSHDWLANTADTVPVFSAFVTFCLRHVGLWPFHAVFFVALMGYFLALWWLVRKLPFGPTNPTVWAAVLIVGHAGIVRLASDRLLGADYPWFFHCGLASQYVLGPGLQPSVIGVLLVAAVAAYLNERPILAAGLAAGANLIHATYLLPAALLVVGFLVHEVLQRQWRTAAVSAGLALLLVLPVVVYDLRTFAPTDAVKFAEAQRILAEIRIPHHTRPARWFDWVAGVQVLWLLLGLVAVRRTRLFVPLAVTYTLVLVGTLAVVLTNHPTLSLLFPWRVTAVLVPVSTAVLFAWGVKRITNGPPPVSAFGVADLPLKGGGVRNTSPLEGEVGRVSEAKRPGGGIIRIGSPFVTLLVALGGVVVMQARLAYLDPDDAALTHVARSHQPGELYLVPARFPPPSTDRGVYSATFRRPPDPGKPALFEMARFRLFTGAPLFVDFKSIPYRDDEVLEWHRRVSAAEKWFATTDWDAAGVIDELRREGVTHVIAPTAKPLKSERLEVVFPGEVYRVYRVK